jgi:riboflavin biosynthesis pyrimidine reductase
LRAGLIDEVSLIVWPVVDGAAGVFDSTPEDANEAAPVSEMKLLQSECHADGSLWLHYQLESHVR